MTDTPLSTPAARLTLLRRLLVLSFDRSSFWLLLLPMIGIRFYTEQNFPQFKSTIFLGLASDILVAGLFTAFISLINKGRVAPLLFALLPLINYLIYWNYEHILANGSNMSVVHFMLPAFHA